jgi:hypothetical protein
MDYLSCGHEREYFCAIDLKEVQILAGLALLLLGSRGNVRWSLLSIALVDATLSWTYVIESKITTVAGGDLLNAGGCVT